MARSEEEGAAAGAEGQRKQSQSPFDQSTESRKKGDGESPKVTEDRCKLQDKMDEGQKESRSRGGDGLAAAAAASDGGREEEQEVEDGSSRMQCSSKGSGQSARTSNRSRTWS